VKIRAVFRILAVCLITFLGIRAYGIVTIEKPPPKLAVPVPTAAQLAAFQGKADNACLCVRRRGHAAYEPCWADYKRSVAPFKPSSISTACAFEANSWDFFAPDEHGVSDMSVTLQRAHDACSAHEEKARIAMASKEMASATGADHLKPIAAGR
jgi:hypothetical protein